MEGAVHKRRWQLGGVKNWSKLPIWGRGGFKNSEKLPTSFMDGPYPMRFFRLTFDFFKDFFEDVFLNSFSKIVTIQCSVSFRIEVLAILFLFISTFSSKKMQIIQKLSCRIFGGHDLLLKELPCKTFTPTLASTISIKTKCRYLSCQSSQLGIETPKRHRKPTNKTVKDHPILVQTLK
jgi:hypothetical protein